MPCFDRRLASTVGELLPADATDQRGEFACEHRGTLSSLPGVLSAGGSGASDRTESLRSLVDHQHESACLVPETARGGTGANVAELVLLWTSDEVLPEMTKLERGGGALLQPSGTQQPSGILSALGYLVVCCSRSQRIVYKNQELERHRTANRNPRKRAGTNLSC